MIYLLNIPYSVMFWIILTIVVALPVLGCCIGLSLTQKECRRCHQWSVNCGCYDHLKEISMEGMRPQ